MDRVGPDRHAATSPRRGKHLGVFASPSPSSEGTQRDEPAQVGGGLPQTHPAALRSGMRMGFETPEQQRERERERDCSGRERDPCDGGIKLKEMLQHADSL